MATTRKRLTLDIDERLQRSLKAAAALQGISMREFCETALQSSVKQESTSAEIERELDRQAMEEMFALSKKIFGDRKLPGDSADIIREGRELRTEQIENWSK